LGLTIAKNIVEAWGGRIGLESQEGQGSTFWFVIPQPKIEANKPH
jgi:signal transduction histidine kinase